MFKKCCFFILVTCSTSLLAEPIDGDDQAFLLDLSKYLGLSSYQKSLLQGDVVHTALLGDEMLPEEISVVGAMLLVKNVSPSMVIETFMDTETFKVVHDMLWPAK